MVVNQLLKYGEFGIVLFDNFQVTERTRNRVASKIARGFESHRLRQRKTAILIEWLRFFCFSAWENYSVCRRIRI